MPRRIFFIYLGRRGALGRFTLELARAAEHHPDIEARLAISRQNAILDEFEPFRRRLTLVPTFAPALSHRLLTGFPAARRALLAAIAEHRSEAAVTLMPHVWSPLIAPAVRRAGVAYATVIHDSRRHEGDRTGLVHGWLMRDARSADRVFTLSRFVADQLAADGVVKPDRITPLFHPDLVFGGGGERRSFDGSRPFRLLMFGRLMRYKGLPNLIEAVRRLRRDHLPVTLGVAGAGDISAEREALRDIGAEVLNRWIEDHEIGPLLARYDAMALPHRAASQSGVAATAFGSLMPVVAAPAGGLSEQVEDGRQGVLAESSEPDALARAIRRLATDGALYDGVVAHLAATRGERTMTHFLSAIATGLKPAAG